MCKVRIVDGALRVGAEVMDAVAQLVEKSLELFLHLESAVVRADGNEFCAGRELTRHAMNNFDLLVVNDVCREGRQTRTLGDTQDRSRFKSADVVLSNHHLRRLITRDGFFGVKQS